MPLGVLEPHRISATGADSFRPRLLRTADYTLTVPSSDVGQQANYAALRGYCSILTKRLKGALQALSMFCGHSRVAGMEWEDSIPGRLY